MKTALVLGGGGFIGNHIVNRLKDEDYWVRVVDLKQPEFQESRADEFVGGNLHSQEFCGRVLLGPEQKWQNDPEGSFDEVYQLAADMGGAGYIFTGDNDAEIMQNSAAINLNVAFFALPTDLCLSLLLIITASAPHVLLNAYAISKVLSVLPSS